MATRSWLQRTLSFIPGIIYTLFYTAAYTPLLSPNTAWISHLLGLSGFALWVKDYPRYWVIFHSTCYLTILWMIYPMIYKAQLPLSLSITLVTFFITLMSIAKSMPMTYITHRFPHYSLSLCGVYWALFEYIQIHVMHFPWILWPQVQGPSPLTGLLSPLPTVLWVTILMALWEYMLYLGIRYMVICVTAILCLTLYQNSYDIPLPDISFAVVQGYIEKDLPAYISLYDAHQEHLKHYTELSHTFSDVDMIIWPECIMGSVCPIRRHAVTLYDALPQHKPLLLGACFSDKGYENTALFIQPSHNHATRTKKHYVPLGENVPIWLQSILHKILPEFQHMVLDSGSEYTSFSFTKNTTLYRFLALICYESTFAAFESMPSVDWIAILNESIWFHSAIAQYQQLAFAQLIAHKFAIPVILSSNNGVTAWIDARGHMREALPINTIGVLEIHWNKKDSHEHLYSH